MLAAPEDALKKAFLLHTMSCQPLKRQAHSLLTYQKIVGIFINTIDKDLTAKEKDILTTGRAGDLV